MEDTQIERLKFHLESGDYFRLLATMFGFLEETVENKCETVPGEMMDIQCETITRFRKDLEYLHQHYQILPKS